MAKDDCFQVDGVVVEALPNATFYVDYYLPAKEGTEPKKHRALAYVSGKIRKNFIRIMPGDTVTLELSLYNLSKGRITFRKK